MTSCMKCGAVTNGYLCEECIRDDGKCAMCERPMTEEEVNNDSAEYAELCDRCTVAFNQHKKGIVQ